MKYENIMFNETAHTKQNILSIKFFFFFLLLKYTKILD